MDTIEISSEEEELVVVPASKTLPSEEMLEVSQVLGDGTVSSTVFLDT